MNHSMKGITQLDFDLAEKIDEFILWNPKTKILLWKALQQIQDLRTLNIINNAKNLDDFYLFGSTNKNLITNDEIKNYKLNQFPLVKGKKTEMTTAITKIKKIIKGRTLHFDGLICDQRSQHSILDLAESLRSSINHCDAEEINNFYAAYQVYGGSLVSFNELRKRADLIIFIGTFDSYVLEKFSKNLSWSSKKTQNKIYYISTKKTSSFKKKIILKGNTINLQSFLLIFLNRKNCTLIINYCKRN